MLYFLTQKDPRCLSRAPFEADELFGWWTIGEAPVSYTHLPLQRKLTQLSKVLTKLVIGICVLVFAIQMIRAGSLNFEVRCV